MIEDKQVVYNTSEDDWTHANEAIEEVVNQRLWDMEEEEILETNSITLYKGTVNKVSFDHYVDVTSILDSMSEWAYDDNEFSEGYLNNVTDAQKHDLHNMICSWAKKHNISTDFFNVGNVEEVVVELTDTMKKEILQ